MQPTNSEPEFWYRIEDRLYAAQVNECGDPSGPGSVDVSMRKFKVLKHTAKGVWLERPFERPRFCLNESIKRFACPSMALALESFLARKAKQQRIYLKRADNAHEAAALAKRRYAENGAQQQTNEILELL